MEWNIKDGNWLEELSDSFFISGSVHLKERKEKGSYNPI